MKFLVGLIQANLARFLVGLTVGAALFTVLVALPASWLLRDATDGARAVFLAVAVVSGVVTALAIGVRLAAEQALQQWVAATGAGPMLAKVICKQALGVSDKRPEGSKEVAEALAGASAEQARATLADRLSPLFGSHALDRWLPQQGRWLAKRLTGDDGWRVTRSQVQTHNTHDLPGLRDAVADALHNKAVELVGARATATVTMVAIAAAGLTLLTALVL